MVQRYQGAGLVQPIGNRVQAIADQFGVTVEEAAQMIKSNPSIGAGSVEGDLGRPFYVPETNQEPFASPSELNLPVLTTSPEEYAKRQRELARESKYREMDSYPGYSGNMTSFTSPDMKGMSAEEVMRDLEAQRRRATEQKAQPIASEEKQPDETPDEYRARLEALYASREPSDWEKAQGYFAMAEQFLDPSKTTMQSVAGAGQAFAQSAAQRDKEKREMDIAREKAMLEYDMGISSERKKAQEAELARTSLSADQQANLLVKSSESVRRIIDSKRDQVSKLSSDSMAQFDPSIKARIAALEESIAQDEGRLMSIEGALAALGEQAYGPIPFEPYSLRSGFVR
jgi:hypothetical protein